MRLLGALLAAVAARARGPRGRGDDLAERLDRPPGRSSPTWRGSTARSGATRRASRWSAAVRRPGSPTPPAGSSTSGWRAAAPLPEDPRGLVFTPFASGGVCLVTNRANPLAALTRARSRTWCRAAPPTGASSAARPAPSCRPRWRSATGARSVFLATFVDDDTPLAYAPRTFSTAAQIRDFVRATPAAWGYVDLAFTRGAARGPLRGRPVRARERRRRRVSRPARPRVRHPRRAARRGRPLRRAGCRPAARRGA